MVFSGARYLVLSFYLCQVINCNYQTIQRQSYPSLSTTIFTHLFRLLLSTVYQNPFLYFRAHWFIHQKQLHTQFYHVGLFRYRCCHCSLRCSTPNIPLFIIRLLQPTNIFSRTGLVTTLYIHMTQHNVFLSSLRLVLNTESLQFTACEWSCVHNQTSP